MPTKPLSPCRIPACPHLTAEGYCVQHKRTHQRATDQHRPSAHARGYDRTWKRLRASHLTIYPLCAPCQAEGRVIAATVVDHIEPHRGDHAKRLDPKNLQSMCATCHNRKTVRHDGGFGNRRRSTHLRSYTHGHNDAA